MNRLLPLIVAIGWLLASADQAFSADVLPGIRERFQAVAQAGPYPETPNFQRHVVSLLGRLGCNGRSCHGSFQGRGGFRLSMFGYDFATDHESLLAGSPPRVNRAAPAQSLILLKPTDADNHEGGQRYDRNGWEYRVLRAWIAAGAKDDSAAAGQLMRLEVTPAEMQFRAAGEQTSFRVIAVWSDGTREDVTCLSRFSSNDDAVATVDEHGQVICRGPGDTYIIASYDNGVDSTPVMLPVTKLTGERFPVVQTSTPIDTLIVQKLRKLGIVPSERCTDAEFLRRVSLDVTGTLPTAEQVVAFAQDTAPDKRLHKVDELLQMPAYASWWATKFCDFTGLNGPLQLGTTEFGPIVSEQWRSWLQRKLGENLPYDKIVEGMTVVVSRRPEQSYEDYALQMSAYTLKREPTDFTARETMPHFWFRNNLGTDDEKALAFAYSYLGVRLDCAQCHKHPFDRWSQQDFKQFAAIFHRVRNGVSPQSQADYDALRESLGVPQMKNAAERRQSYWRWAAEGRAVPWPEVFVAAVGDWQSGQGAPSRRNRDPSLQPKLLGGALIDEHATVDPRRELMSWLRDKENPYFSRAIVNRVWSHYLGRGLVEPADDLNLANPPANKELFDYLAREFIEHGYDLKWLQRTIIASDAYQRSWITNETNRDDERHFSRGKIRRLPAEVAVDAMHLATVNSARAETFATIIKDRRIAVQAGADHSRTEFGLSVFGKPLRNINCDCEREQEPSLAQALFVRNDKDLNQLLDRTDGWLAELAKPAKGAPTLDVAVAVTTAYRRALSREPTPAELQRSLAHVSAAETPLAGLRDVLWALLNTQEFITNH